MNNQDSITDSMQTVAVSKPTKKPRKQPQMTVVVEPLPLPDNFQSILAQIYALALQRYREHAAQQGDKKVDGAA